MKIIKIEGYNNLELFTRIYDEVTNPKAVVQIIHGMLEHSARYDRFAKMLNKNGYIVYVTDLRGHGNTALSIDKLGHGEKDIFNECMLDQIMVGEYIKKHHNLPLYIFAHSWGSMIAQKLIQEDHQADKIILCGTNIGSDPSFKLGKLISNTQALFVNSEKPANLIIKVNNNLYQKRFVRGNWLSRDEDVYDKYLADPFCTAKFPISFYKSLFNNMTKVNKNISKIKTDLKVFLIAGDQDPVSNYSKNISKLYNLYTDKGINVECKIYKGARHELINEINKDEVDKDIVSFFDK